MMILDLIFPKCHGNQCFWNFTDTFMPLKFSLRGPQVTTLHPANCDSCSYL